MSESFPGNSGYSFHTVHDQPAKLLLDMGGCTYRPASYVAGWLAMWGFSRRADATMATASFAKYRNIHSLRMCTRQITETSSCTVC